MTPDPTPSAIAVEAKPEVRGPRPEASPAATLVQQAATSAGSPDDLSDSVVSEVRASLRGCTPESLATTLGAPSARIAAALAALESSGTLAKRGTRWFMA